MRADSGAGVDGRGWGIDIVGARLPGLSSPDADRSAARRPSAGDRHGSSCSATSCSTSSSPRRGRSSRRQRRPRPRRPASRVARRRTPPAGSARLGARSSLIAAVGRDATGRALVEALRADGVVAPRLAGRRRPDRADRRARRRRRRAQLRPGPRGGRAARRPTTSGPAGSPAPTSLHLPIYSLLGAPLGDAGRRAIELGRAAGAAVSVDLASIGPLLAGGRRAARA